jgi:hypothetical protein
MRAVVPLVAVSMLLTVGGLNAQQSRAIPSGQRVRVTAPDCDLRKQRANLDGWRGDTLVLGMVYCPLASVARLEVNRGSSGHAAIGLLVGWFVGAVIGYSTADECPANEQYGLRRMSCFGHIDPWAAMVLGSVVGAGLGTVIGAFIKTDRWEEVRLDRLRVSFAPQRDGFAFGVSFAF